MTQTAGLTGASSTRVVARNVATLGVGELLSRLIGFIATIYVARRLGAEAYGVIGFGFAVLLYATAVVDGGLEHTGPREVAERRDRLGPLFSTLLLTRLLLAAVGTAVMLIVAQLLFTGPERLVVSLYALALLPVGANTRWLHIGLEQSALVSGARVLSELVRVVAVLALVRGPADLGVVPLAQLAGDALAAGLLLAGVRGIGARFEWRIDRALARDVFGNAAPMVASALLALMIYNADLVFLRLFRDSVEIGLYLAGYTLINFLGILGHVLALTLVPTFTRLRGSPEARAELYHDGMARAFAAGLPIAVGGCLVARLLIETVFGNAYTLSAPVLAILIWSLPVVLLRSVLQAALISAGRQQSVLRTTLWAAIANVVLNTLAVPVFGMYGAAVTTVIAETVRMATALHYAHRAGFPVTVPRRYVRSIGAAVALAGVLLVLRPSSVWLALPVGAMVYTVALLLVGGLHLGRTGIKVTV